MTNYRSYMTKGILCYLGNHYITYMRADKDHPDFGTDREWKLFDDAAVIIKKGGIAEIISDMITSNITPVMIFFEKIPQASGSQLIS